MPFRRKLSASVSKFSRITYQEIFSCKSNAERHRFPMIVRRGHAPAVQFEKLIVQFSQFRPVDATNFTGSYFGNVAVDCRLMASTRFRL